MPPIYVLAVDPAFRNFGWAAIEMRWNANVVCAGSVITTKKADKKARAFAGDDNHRCTQTIATDLDRVLKQFKPKLIMSEAQSGSKSSKAAQLMGMSWAILSTLALVHGVPVLQARPAEVKLATVGKVTASKDEIEAAVRQQFPEADAVAEGVNPRALREHFYDAIAVFVACCASNEVRTLRLLVEQ